MKKTYQEQYDDLFEQMCLDIKNQIKKVGTKSDFNSKNVIKVDEKYEFNMTDDKYLIEISEEMLIDNYGYRYNFSFISMENFIELVDWINTL